MYNETPKTHLYRATVYVLSSVAAAVDGDEGIVRYVTEEHAESARMFEAQVRDRYIHDVDTEVWFGPISKKRGVNNGQP